MEHGGTGKSKTERMRELIASPKLCVSPGVYDGYSARVAEAMGFATVSTSGAAIANARLGVPEETGILSLMENVEACRQIARAVSIPIMSDADTGYGNAVTVRYTVQYFEEAGVVGVNLEDQATPKRCGHLAGIELIDALEMAKKIESAVDARKDARFIINARTDAIRVEGFDGALRRAKMYAAAGADMIYPEGVRDEDEIHRMVEEVGIPISINMGFGIRRRASNLPISFSRLEELGVARASVPRFLTAAAIKGMINAIAVLNETIASGEVVDRPDLLVNFDEILELMEYPKVQQLENRYLAEEQLRKKYG
jgi:2-methylisocitrate lyase-like PEP mutase family enzyme